MIELPAQPSPRPDRRRSRVLQLRHQRSHPDHLWHLARRHQPLPAVVHQTGHLQTRSLCTLDQAGVGLLVKMATAKGRNTRPNLKSASAASMAAIRNPSSSATRSASTTSPARPSVCSPQGWPPPGRAPGTADAGHPQRHLLIYNSYSPSGARPSSRALLRLAERIAGRRGAAASESNYDGRL